MDNLRPGSAAINRVFDSFTKTVGGAEGNTYTSTHEADGVYHSLVPNVGNTDAYYEVNIGTNGVPVAVLWTGYAASKNDNYGIYAWNWALGDWDQIGSRKGDDGIKVKSETFPLTIAHVGTAADVGKVRFRFLSADGTAFGTDFLLCSYTYINDSIGYLEGAVWIDTVLGTAGTVIGVNGVADNPVLTLADAYTLATAIGVKSFHLIRGTEITLTADTTNTRYNGSGTIHLGGVAIVNARFKDTFLIDGIGTGDESWFTNCRIGDLDVAHAHFTDCNFGDELTMTAGKKYFMRNGNDVSITQCEFTFAAGVKLLLRDWRGGLQINSMAAGDVMFLDGAGRLVIDATCGGGAITVRGHFGEITGAAAFLAAGGTITEVARIAADTINTEADAALVDISLDHLMAVATAGADMTAEVVDNSALSRLLANGNTSGFDPATDGLQPIRDRGDAEWDTAVGFAIAGDAMNLAADAIKAVSYDETTAWPVTASDAGVTQIARVGADGDTLEDISDEIATAQVDLTLLTGADGATLASLQPNYAPALVGDAMTLANNAVTAAVVATDAIDADALAADAIDKILDEPIGDGVYTMREALRIAISALAGDINRTGTQFRFRDMADTLDRITGTVNVAGERTITAVNA